MANLDSIDLSISKGTLNEIDGSILDGQDVISTERLHKNDTLMGTYKVLSGPIKGGMGSVWCVRHLEDGNIMAMKRPQPKYFAEGSARRKEVFIRECESWIRLALHPNVVACFYVRDISGVPRGAASLHCHSDGAGTSVRPSEGPCPPGYEARQYPPDERV